MKTSVIEVRDMLTVLIVEEVEKRLCDVPGVESATVNHAAGNATVRYDETLLEVADIKVMVHQRGQQSAGESGPKQVSEHKPAHKHALEATPASASTPVAGVPKAAPVAPAAMPAPAASAVEGQEGEPAPGAPPSPAAAVPKT